MEGTRNERVAILLTAYFIGFVTAYIAFGVTQLEDKIKYVSAPAIQNAAVIQAQTTNALLTIDSHGLSVVVNGEVRLLSALVDGKTELEMREGERRRESDGEFIVRYRRVRRVESRRRDCVER